MNWEDSQYWVNSGYWPYAGIWLGGSAGHSGFNGWNSGIRNNNTGTFPWVWTNGSPGLYKFLISYGNFYCTNKYPFLKNKFIISMRLVFLTFI